MVRQGASARAWKALDQLHDVGLNFELERRDEFTPQNGWRIDKYCTLLPTEPPGPPVEGGSWETAARLIADHEFAEPSIVRAALHSARPTRRRGRP